MIVISHLSSECCLLQISDYLLKIVIHKNNAVDYTNYAM